MPHLKVIADGDGCWPDLSSMKYINAMGEDTKIEIAALPGGMSSGKSSIAFRVKAPTGEVMVFETSLRLLKNAVDLFQSLYGE